jgi:hypothetical protein
MAPITRTPIVNDDGSLTVGTVFENGWKTELYNQIDAAISGSVAAPPGNVSIGGGFALAGSVSIAIAGGTYNSYAPANGVNKAVWVFNHTGNVTLTGLASAGEPVGALHLIVNQTGYTLLFKNASASSPFADQIIGPGYADLTLGSWGSIWVRRAELGCWLLLKA